MNVTQVFTVDRGRLVQKIGTLTPSRVQEIYRGLQLLLEPLERV